MFLTCSLALQESTSLLPCAGNELPQSRHHYHPGLPTATHSLLQLHQHHLQEELGPTAVRGTLLLGLFSEGGRAWLGHNQHIPTNASWYSQREMERVRGKEGARFQEGLRQTWGLNWSNWDHRTVADCVG